jgi:hypothetical protein
MGSEHGGSEMYLWHLVDASACGRCHLQREISILIATCYQLGTRLFVEKNRPLVHATNSKKDDGRLQPSEGGSLALTGQPVLEGETKAR